MKVKGGDPRLPTAINTWSDASIASIGCGDDFSVCIMDDGLVYTFGRGMCGQLGHNDQNDCWTARQAFLNTSLVVEDVEMSQPSSLSSSLNDSSGINALHSMMSSSGRSQSAPRKSHSREPSYGNLSTNSPIISSAHDHSTHRGLESIAEDEAAQNALAQSSILSSSDSISTYTDSLLLENSLQVLVKRYRPSVILHQCIMADNLSAASLILEQCGAWAASIDCKIRLLRREFPKMTADVATQTHLLTELIKDLAQPSVPEFARQEGLKKLLTLWKSVGASESTLESLLKGSTLVTALARILEAQPPSSQGLGGIILSPKFMLTIVQAGLEQQHADYNAKRASYGVQKSTSIFDSSKKTTTKQGGRAQSILTSDPAWTERKDYFERELKVRTKIQISQPALEDFIQHAYPVTESSKLPTSGNPAQSGLGPAKGRNGPAKGEDKNVVFTCGHMLTEKRLAQSTLPLFRDKMAKFPVPLPLTLKLLIMDFQSPSCNTACPPCVYNYLKDKHAPKLERWNPQ